MPQSHPSRRDSWPPTILRLFDDDLNTVTNSDLDGDIDMDSNPFEYFLTSPEDPTAEDDYFEDLSAGIEADNTPETPVREVSPSSLQRLAMETTKDDSQLSTAGQGYAVPLSLRDFTLSHSAAKKNATRQPVDADTSTASTTTGNDTQIVAARGRRAVRLGARGRGKTRNLESPRPRSWRGPSPDVWSIPEEGETPGLSADEEAIVIQKEPAKKKKKVHWAI